MSDEKQFIVLPIHLIVFNFIEAYIKVNGYAPTLNEVAAELGKTPQTILRIVNQLVGVGSLGRVPKARRGLTVIKSPRG